MSALLGALRAAPAAATALVVGFSGGRDSTALLHALAQLSPAALPLRAIHVCHHLQPQAQAWAEHCAARCAEWQVAFTRLDVDVVDTGHGVEAAARTTRYGAIAQTLRPGEVLVTAHHARDQAETFLLQALRGAGVKGLAAMPAYAEFGHGGHWRPWLAIDDAQIDAYVSDNRLSWIEDPSNADPAVDRSYLRASILPALSARWPAFARTLARSAQHAAQAADSIAALAAEDLAAAEDDARALRCDDLRSFDARRRCEVIRLWLARSGRDRPDHRHLEQIEALVDARMAASPCVCFAHTDVRAFDDRLFCMPSLPAEPTGASLAWYPPQPLELPAGCGRLTIASAAEKLAALTVTFRRGGERLGAADDAPRLKEWLRVARIPPWIRERMPLVYAGDTLVAVAHYWRHPEFERLLGGAAGPVRWDHELPGEPARVVAAEPFG
ncbi:tRNA lysidine(34) synthetase TilS [Salinisphaera aquimarina]|uniref:tRNA(Ile)-lysidine synthase n=1 Tax=Salinisphaera aquimarina TaxID=2094031 RepID=A0ABV7ERZ6_9GAMM